MMRMYATPPRCAADGSAKQRIGLLSDDSAQEGVDNRHSDLYHGSPGANQEVVHSGAVGLLW